MANTKKSTAVSTAISTLTIKSLSAKIGADIIIDDTGGYAPFKYVVFLTQGEGELADDPITQSLFTIEGLGFTLLLDEKQADVKTWKPGELINVSLDIDNLRKHQSTCNICQKITQATGDNRIVHVAEISKAIVQHSYSMNAGVATPDTEGVVLGKGQTNNSAAVARAEAQITAEKDIKQLKHRDFELTDHMAGWPKIIAIPNISAAAETMKIGYASLNVPMASLLMEKQTQPLSIPMIRSASNVKRGVGAGTERYTFYYQVQGKEDLDRNVVDVLNQLLHTPFLPITGFDEIANIDALAIRNFSIATIAGVPDALQVQITAEPFMWSNYCYTLKRTTFEDAICWPLFKLWCETKGKKSIPNDVGDNRWSNGRLVFQFPDHVVANKLEEISSDLEPVVANDAEVWDFFRTVVDLGDLWRKSASRLARERPIGAPIKFLLNKNGELLTRDKLVIAVRINESEMFRDTLLSRLCFGVYPTESSDSILEINESDDFYRVPILPNLTGSLAPYDAGKLSPWGINKAGLSTSLYMKGLPYYSDIKGVGKGTEFQKVLDSVSLTAADIKANPNNELRDLWMSRSLLLVIDPSNEDDSKMLKNLIFLSANVNKVKTASSPDMPKYETPEEKNKAVSAEMDKLEQERIVKEAAALANDKLDNSEDTAWNKFQQEAPRFEIAVEGNMDEVVIEEVSVSREHNLSHHQLRGSNYPSHQYTGMSEALIKITGTMFSLSAVAKLSKFVDESNARSRESIIPTSLNAAVPSYHAYARVENDVCQLMGVEFVLPISLTVQVRQSEPEAWDFTLSLVEYDLKAQNQEAIRELPTWRNNAGSKAGVIDFNGNEPPWIATTQEFLEIESILKENWEPYEEMSLPKWEEVDTWIKMLKTGMGTENELRIAKPWIDKYSGLIKHLDQSENLRGWADPDFYMGYWREDDTPEPIGCVIAHELMTGAFSDNERNQASPEVTTKKESKKQSRAVFTSNPVCNAFSEPLQDNMGLRLVGTDGNAGYLPPEFLSQKDQSLGQPNNTYYPDIVHQNYTSDEQKRIIAEGSKYAFDIMSTVAAVDPYWGLRWAKGSSSLLDSSVINGNGNGLKVFPETSAEIDKSLTDAQREAQAVLEKNRNERLNRPPAYEYSQLSVPFWQPTGESVILKREYDYDADIACGTDFKWEPIQGQRGNESTLNHWLRKSINEIYRIVELSAADNGGYSNEGLLLPTVDTVSSIQPLKRGLSPSLDGGGKGRQRWQVYKVVGNDADGWNFDFYKGGTELNSASYLNTSLNDFMGASQRNAIYRYYYARTSAAIRSGVGDQTKTSDALLYDNTDVRTIIEQTSVKYDNDSNLLRAIFRCADDANPNYVSEDKKRMGLGLLPQDDSNVYNGLQGKGGATGSVRGDIIGAAIRYDKLRIKYKKPVLTLYAYYLGEKEFNAALASLGLTNFQSPKGERFDFQNIASIPDRLNEALVGVSAEKEIQWYRTLAEGLLSNGRNDEDIKGAVNFVEMVYRHWKASTASHGFSTENNDTIFGWGNNSLFLPKGVTDAASIPQNGFDAYNPVNPYTPEVGFWNFPSANTPRVRTVSDKTTWVAEPLKTAKDFRMREGMYAPITPRGIVGALKDTYEHDMNGRLVNAFPNYLMLFIDEGATLGRIKMWDHYYIRGAVSAIEINHSKDRATGVAQVTLSNLFGRLTSQSIFEETREKILRQMRDKSLHGTSTGAIVLNSAWDRFNEWAALYLGKTPPEWMLKAWQSHINRIAIQAGTRIHIRLGYGSNPEALPICFNGTISEMPVHDGMVSLVALSDGQEMTNAITHSLTFDEGHSAYFQQQGQFGGKEPAAIMHDLFSARGLLATLTAGAFESDPNAGLSHWGSQWYIGDFYLSPFNRYNPTEIQINMYTSSPNIERNYMVWKNFFNANVLYNYDDVQLIGVKVKEPTPWKVCQVLRKAVFEYIAYPFPFQFRHTMFFGNRWYPLYYRYNSLPSASPKEKEIVKSIGRGSTAVGLTPADALEVAKTIGRVMTDASLDEKIKRWETNVVGGTNSSELLTNITVYKTVKEAWNSAPPEITKQILNLPYETADNPSTDEGDSLTSGPPTFQVIAGRLTNTWNNLTSNPNPTPEETKLQYAFKDLIRVCLQFPVSIAVDNGPRGTAETEAPGNNYTFGRPDSTGVDVDKFTDPEWLSQFMDWKPFCQVHFADGDINLISNEVVTSDENVYTNATGIYDYGGMNFLWLNGVWDAFTKAEKMGKDYICQTRTYSVDTDILPHYQRTMLVDTGVFTDWIMAGKDMLIGVSQIANSQGTPAAPSVENAVVTSLIDTVKTMYQGWLVVQGSPTMWPHHMVYINDARSKLSGLAGVREVTQHFSAEMGFVTGIAPECVAVSRGAQHEMLWIGAIASYCIRSTMIQGTLKVGAALWRAGMHMRKVGMWKEAEDFVKLIDEKMPALMEGVVNKAAIEMQAALEKDIAKTVTKEVQTRLLQEEATKLHPGKQFTDIVGDELKEVHEAVTKRLENPAFSKQITEEVAETSKKRAIIETKKVLGDISRLPKGALNPQAQRLIAVAMSDKDLKVLVDVKRSVEKIKLASMALPEGERLAFCQAEIKGMVAKGKLDDAFKVLKGYMAADGKYALLAKELTDDSIMAMLKGVNFTAQKELLMTTSEIAKINELSNLYRKQMKEVKAALKDVKNGVDAKKIKFAKGTRPEIIRRELAYKGLYSEVAEKGDDVIIKIARKPNSTVDKLAIDELKQLSKNGAKRGKFLADLIGKGVGEKFAVQKAARSVPKIWASLVEALGRDTTKVGVARTKSALTFLKKCWTGEGLLASIASGQWYLTAVQLAFQVVQLIMIDTFMEAMNDYFTARQVAMIFPLKIGYIPLLAGILGHQGCVAGDEPSMIDHFFEGLTGGLSVAEGADSGFGWTTQILNFLGIEAINYGNVFPSDLQLIEADAQAAGAQ